MAKKLTTDGFIEKARVVHGDKYDYSKVEYINNKTKVEIICPRHGSFFQRPIRHLQGDGCRECSKEKLSKLYSQSKDKFVEKARNVHGDKYDYSKVDYRGANRKVTIICPKHGEFLQTPGSHVYGSGCMKCAKDKLSKRFSHSDRFVEKARVVHGDKYDYSKVKYINNRKNVEIICYKHGSFFQTPGAHLSGQGCRQCQYMNNTLTTEGFIKKALSVHGRKYIYSKVKYIRTDEKVTIICQKHGEFQQIPYVHLQGKGCPVCGKVESIGEREVADYLSTLGFVVETRVRLFDGNNFELDIVIPEMNVAIEYNGVVFHSEKFGKDKNYHRNKTEMAEKYGMRLIHVWETDWKYRRDIVKRMLRHVLGKTDEPKIYARKTKAVELTGSVFNSYVNKWHIQGSGSSFGKRFYRGLEDSDGNIVAVASFSYDSKRDLYSLDRYTTCGYQVPGGMGKLLKEFRDKDIITFADRCISQGGLYEKLGFIKVGELKVDYKYYISPGRDLDHKSLWRRKKIRKYAETYGIELPSGWTERSAMQLFGFYRVWDCGKIRYMLPAKR